MVSKRASFHWVESPIPHTPFRPRPTSGRPFRARTHYHVLGCDKATGRRVKGDGRGDQLKTLGLRRRAEADLGRIGGHALGSERWEEDKRGRGCVDSRLARLRTWEESA